MVSPDFYCPNKKADIAVDIITKAYIEQSESFMFFMTKNITKYPQKSTTQKTL